MMKVLYVFLIFGIILVGASTFKDKNLNPVIEEPQLPGTPTPVEEVNTSPNPTPAENQSEVFRGSTVNGRKRAQEDQKRHQMQQRKQQKKRKGPGTQKGSP